MIGGMGPFRVVQVSDTHLSARHPPLVSNFHTAGRIIAALGPDLVVNTGDITFDGSNSEADLAFGHACHAALGIPVRASTTPARPATPGFFEERRRRCR